MIASMNSNPSQSPQQPNAPPGRRKPKSVFGCGTVIALAILLMVTTIVGMVLDANLDKWVPRGLPGLVLFVVVATLFLCFRIRV
jgi:hypothetical protein